MFSNPIGFILVLDFFDFGSEFSGRYIFICFIFFVVFVLFFLFFVFVGFLFFYVFLYWVFFDGINLLF